MFRYSYATRSFVSGGSCQLDAPLLEILDAIAFAGYDGVELWCDRPQAYLQRMTYREVARIRRRLDSLGLAVSCLDASTHRALGGEWSPSWCAEPAVREARLLNLMGCIRLAGLLDTRLLSIGAGGPGGGEQEAEFEALAEALEVLLPHAEESGVTLLLEPAPGGVLETSEELERFLQRFPTPHLGASLDVGSLFCVREDPSDSIRSLEERICLIRLGDRPPSRAPHRLQLGEGVLDFGAILEAAEEIAYAGFLTVSLSPDLSKGELPEEIALRALERLSNFEPSWD